MTRTQTFVNEAIRIADDNRHGYSQADRWNIDFDCSSLMYICGYKAGYDLPKSGTRYTGTMIEHFSKCGFRVDPFDGNLSDLEIGDILLNTQYHTAVYIGGGEIVEASQSETGGTTGQQGDQTGHEIHVNKLYNYPWTHVLTPPKESASQQQPSSSEYKPVSHEVKSIRLEDAITRVAIEAINGKFGNGDARKNNIYNIIQARINQLLSGK